MNRKHTVLLASAAVLALTLNCELAQARRGSSNVSLNGQFSFQLESNGRPLPTYQHRGYTYVEGQMGDYYAIRVYNHSSRRVEAVVTVDGRDVITGRPGNYRTSRGYVIEAWGSVLIEGFRKSMSDVAAFHFTDVDDSYAARMGNATNVGVIGVAIFEERVWRPLPPVPPIPLAKDRRNDRLGTGYAEGEAGSRSQEPRAKKESKARRGVAPSSSADCLGCYEEYVPHRPQELGTGYGHETYSPATETRFIRRSPRRPNATLSIYYDDRQGLIDKGVLPRPSPPYRPYYEQNPFPSSPDPRFAPPPPPRY